MLKINDTSKVIEKWNLNKSGNLAQDRVNVQDSDSCFHFTFLFSNTPLRYINC